MSCRRTPSQPVHLRPRRQVLPPLHHLWRNRSVSPETSGGCWDRGNPTLDLIRIHTAIQAQPLYGDVSWKDPRTLCKAVHANQLYVLKKEDVVPPQLVASNTTSSTAIRGRLWILRKHREGVHQDPCQLGVNQGHAHRDHHPPSYRGTQVARAFQGSCGSVHPRPLAKPWRTLPRRILLGGRHSPPKGSRGQLRVWVLWPPELLRLLLVRS